MAATKILTLVTTAASPLSELLILFMRALIYKRSEISLIEHDMQGKFFFLSMGYRQPYKMTELLR